MMRWHIQDGREGYAEYVGHTIAGAAYAMFPAGRRAKVARALRETCAYNAHRARSPRIGRQCVRVPLHP